jgi:hypothetical protein
VRTGKKSESFGDVINITSFSMLSIFLISSLEIFAPKQRQMRMLHMVSGQLLIASTNPFSDASLWSLFMWFSIAHFRIQPHCFTLVRLISSITKLRRRVLQSGPYSAELMAHFPTLNRSRIGESFGRLANAGPLWTMASWMSSALVTITSVRWPICMLYREIVRWPLLPAYLVLLVIIVFAC